MQCADNNLHKKTNVIFYVFIVFFFLISFFEPSNAASVEEYQSIKNDPTKPIYSEMHTPEKSINRQNKNDRVIELQSIFYSVTQKIATINGVVMKEGDALNEILLEKVNRDFVVIQFMGYSRELSISKKISVNNITGAIRE